jgi:opacity protein-like surface antigen
LVYEDKIRIQTISKKVKIMIKPILLGTILSVTSISFAVADEAKYDEKGHWYIGASGGYSLLGKEMSKGSNFDLYTIFKDSFVIDGSVGYDFGNFRLEGELSFHNHNAKNFEVMNAGPLGFGSGSATGKAKLTSYMINGVFDFGSKFEDSKFEPFVGAGIGFADLRLNNLRSGNVSFTNGTDNVFAYQAFAGVRFAVSENFDISAKYRYLATSDSDMMTAQSEKFKTSYDVHDFMIGLTYRFGTSSKPMVSKPVMMAEPAPTPTPTPEPVVVLSVPEPVVVPEPAPEPVLDLGPYKVYFAFDSSDLTIEALEILKAAAQNVALDENIRVSLGAHTDTSGSNSYNAKLGARRGASVRAELIRLGVNAEYITISNNIEKNQEVITADNVKNGYNRRVTIFLSK